ncbi:FAD-dependent oxidoreductase [soil metagenome]
MAGGGHAHLHSLLNAKDFVERGCEVVLVNPSPYLYYSGMATGVISGIYTPEQVRMNVQSLIERGGGRFVEGRVTGVSAGSRKILLEDGDRMPYDYASLCIGSEVKESFTDDGRTVPVKPVENTAEIRARILNPPGAKGPTVLVIGGGAAGCEVAANAANLMKHGKFGGHVILAEAGSALLGSAPLGAQKAITSYLRSRNVEVLTGSSIISCEDGVAETGSGRRLDVDVVVAAVGIVPRALSEGTPLLTGAGDGLWVNHSLQSVSERRVFGGGDSISFRGEALPRLGVFGIRQGPVLFHNLLAALDGRPLKSYQPQKHYLYILNLGDGTGLAIYGSYCWMGRWVMRLKHAIDKSFMRRYGAWGS